MRRWRVPHTIPLAFGILLALASPPGASRAEARPAYQVIVVLDPICPHAGTMIERVREFRRLHPEISIRLLVPDPGAFARTPDAALTALQREDLTFEWDPMMLQALGVTATPAVAVLDARGRGVRALGSPDLSLVLRAARGQAP